MQKIDKAIQVLNKMIVDVHSFAVQIINDYDVRLEEIDKRSLWAGFKKQELKEFDFSLRESLDHQNAASNHSVISGYGGCGKTYLANKIGGLWINEFHRNVIVLTDHSDFSNNYPSIKYENWFSKTYERWCGKNELGPDVKEVISSDKIQPDTMLIIDQGHYLLEEIDDGQMVEIIDLCDLNKIHLLITLDSVKPGWLRNRVLLPRVNNYYLRGNSSGGSEIGAMMQLVARGGKKENGTQESNAISLEDVINNSNMDMRAKINAFHLGPTHSGMIVV